MKTMKQIVVAVGAACVLGTIANVQAAGKPLTAGGVAAPAAVTAPTVIHGVTIAPPAKGGGGAVVPTAVHGLIITQAHGQTVVTKAPAAAGL